MACIALRASPCCLQDLPSARPPTAACSSLTAGAASARSACAAASLAMVLQPRACTQGPFAANLSPLSSCCAPGCSPSSLLSCSHCFRCRSRLPQLSCSHCFRRRSRLPQLSCCHCPCCHSRPLQLSCSHCFRCCSLLLSLFQLLFPPAPIVSAAVPSCSHCFRCCSRPPAAAHQEGPGPRVEQSQEGVPHRPGAREAGYNTLCCLGGGPICWASGVGWLLFEPMGLANLRLARKQRLFADRMVTCSQT